MSLNDSDTRPDLVWLTESELDRCAIDPGLRSWLLHPTLLTRRLRRVAGAGFRLEELAKPLLSRRVEGWCPGGFPGGHRRDVLLWCGDRPFVYAQTRVRQSTLAANPWLGELGSEPLGERLESIAGVGRGAFSFSDMGADPLLNHVGGQPTHESGHLWARRSEFRIGADPFDVLEIFLDAAASAKEIASTPA